jgi:hypothetical protein
MTLLDQEQYRRRKYGIFAVALVGLALIGLSAVMLGGGSSEVSSEAGATPSHDGEAVPHASPCADGEGEVGADGEVVEREAVQASPAEEQSDSAREQGAVKLEDLPQAPAAKAAAPTPKPAPRSTIQRSKCANPTYVDEKGIKRFKVECL